MSFWDLQTDKTIKETFRQLKKGTENILSNIQQTYNDAVIRGIQENRIKEERSKTFKEDVQKRVDGLLNSELRNYGERCLFSAKGKHYASKIILTDNRVLYTAWKADIPDITGIFVVDIPYTGICNMHCTPRSPYRLEIYSTDIHGSNKKSNIIQTLEISNKELISQIKKYAGGELGKSDRSLKTKMEAPSRYINHCWNCGVRIDSDVNRRCSRCGMFFCSNCGKCLCTRS